jgi:transposase
MAKPLSDDLRSRVIEAVEGGMSRRAAAARFGVSASSAVRWVAAWRGAGRVGAEPQGGDRRSHRIEAFGATVLAAVAAQVGIAPVELATPRRGRHGARFAPSSVWRFLDRHGGTVKTNRARRRTLGRFLAYCARGDPQHAGETICSRVSSAASGGAPQ